MISALVSSFSFYFTEEMARSGGNILVGQDNCDPDITFSEMRLLSECNLSNAEIILGATLYAAESLNVVDQFGSIEVDKRANILILNKNPLEDINNMTSTFNVIKDGDVILRNE
ncbi:amidohydrolase family protein [candidate division CSSED10-310 bacterium]|uniref:Amidohydrolase family protein n=1 Tax=candidate division CSSED10-310 bacterium TaxID=2855610 RepID=A0ABV6Z1E6_UNCC1